MDYPDQKTQPVLSSDGSDSSSPPTPNQQVQTAAPQPAAVTAPSTTPTSQPPTTPAPAAQKQILLIEDDPIILRMYSTKLTNSGFLVKEAADGQSALDLIGSFRPDIILLDLMLPKVDGFGFLEKSKDVLSGIPVIILSNLSQESDKNRAKLYGAVDFLVKADITPQDVVNAIQKHI